MGVRKSHLLTKDKREGGSKFLAAFNVEMKLTVPTVRLPIGPKVTFSRDVVKTGSVRFRLHVPSSVGGRLFLSSTPSAPGKLLRRGNVVRSGNGDLTHFVGKGEHGEYIYEVEGPPEDFSVQCGFFQSGTARDGTADTDPPIVPWHFWFWPSTRSSDLTSDQELQQATLNKLSRALGDPSAQPGKWEKDHHTREGDDGWAGHCHWAALASATLMQPADNPSKEMKIGGVVFTQDELEFLATEWTANFGRWAEVFRLQGIKGSNKDIIKGADGKPLKNADGTPDIMFVPTLRLFKPSERPTRELLEKRLRQWGISLPKENADKIFKRAGGTERKLRREVKRGFARAAVAFYEDVLLDAIRKEKLPLSANLRAGDLDEGKVPTPGEVWNHTVFLFSAQFFEERDTDQRMNVLGELFANDDVRSSEGAPATVVQGHAAPNLTAIVSAHEWTIFFKGSGAPDDDHWSNQWWQSRGARTLQERSQSNFGIDTYAIDEVIRPMPPQPVRRNATGLSSGNPVVPRSLVGDGQIRLRKRFRKP